MGPTTTRPTLSEPQQRAMQAIVAAVPPLLIEAYGQALLSVVLFGSVARGTAHNHSDSDWLVVLRQRSAQPRNDHNGVAAMHHRLAPLLAAAAGTGLITEAQVHLRSASEAEQGGPMFLDLCHDGIPLHDPEGWGEKFMANYRKRLQLQGSVRVPWGDGWYWRLTPEVKPASEVWF